MMTILPSQGKVSSWVTLTWNALHKTLSQATNIYAEESLKWLSKQVYSRTFWAVDNVQQLNNQERDYQQIPD